jgi:hypothetical protein
MRKMTFLLLYFASGMLGAYLMMCLQVPLGIGRNTLLSDDKAGVVHADEQKTAMDVLKVHRIEIVDDTQKVRSVITTDSSGYASFSMLSKEDVPVVELSVSEDTSHGNDHTPYGRLTIGNGTQAPLIQLGTRYPGAGSLLFSSPRVHGMLTVGYDIAGDVEDKEEHGVWGVIVKGTEHRESIMGVRTYNWLPREFIAPQVDNRIVEDMDSPKK